MRDQLTNFFCDRFRTESAMMSEEAKAMRSCLASLIFIDILGVESRHASSRRVVNQRSVQTWSLGARNLSAEWVTRQHMILREAFKPKSEQKQVPKRRARGLEPSQSKGPRRGLVVPGKHSVASSSSARGLERSAQKWGKPAKSTRGKRQPTVSCSSSVNK